jgi:protein SCO1
MKSSRSASMRRAMVTAAAAWIAACAVALAGAGAGATVHAAGAAAGRARSFPNVTLTTHQGKQVRFFDDLIKGKIVAIDLIYTTCQYACPLETARLAQVQRLIGDRMGRDVFFYSITIDPDHDTPAVLDDYARKYGAGPGWLFLTGAKPDIDLLSKRLGLYSEPDPANPDGHLPYLLVGNEATGEWMRNSAVDNPKFLARTIADWLNGWRQKSTLKAYAESPTTAFDAGQYTFGYHCAACHTIGGGTRIGPDLDGITSRRDRAWLEHFIAAPDRMNANGDPIAVALRKTYQQARMPNLDLTDEDIAAVIDYVDGRSRALHEAAAEPVRTPVASPPSSSSVPVRTLLDAYLRIQHALYTDTITSIRDDARAIELEAATLGAAAEPIRAAATPFRDVADLKAARAAFGVLSDQMIALMRGSAAGSGENVSVAFCPMAQKYWIQKGERVENPYYGAAMPECGRVVGGADKAGR